MPNVIRGVARKAFTIAIGVIGLMLAGDVVGAAEDAAITRAREHYQRGTAFYDLGRYQDAIKEFEAAYEAKNDPAFLYNLAQAHRLAGNTDQALHFYRTYLRRVPKAPNRDEIEERITALERVLDDKKGTQIPPNHVVPPDGNAQQPGETSPPPPATGAAPGAITGPPPVVASPTIPPPPPPPPAAPAPDPVLITTPAPEGDPGKAKRTLGLVAGGVGIVAVVGAIFFGQGARSAAQEITDAGTNGELYSTHLQDVDSRGRRYQTLQFVSLGVGAAALGGGALLYFSGTRAPEAPARIGLLPVLIPGGGAAALRGSF